jgi:hypothetical protein
MAAFTTIATAVGLAATVGSTAMSFTEAKKQKRKQREAEKKAEAAMAEVRKQLSINYFDQVAIKKEPYELQREALLSQGALAIQAGAESERGGATTAGMVQMAQNQGQAGIRTDMGEKMSAIELQSLEEESRLRDLNAQLSLGQVEGAQLAAANAQEAAMAANQQGYEGIVSGIQQGVAMIPLFKGDGGITISGSDKGPGANPLFQSSASDQFSSSVSAPGPGVDTSAASINPYMPNSSNRINPYLYENMFSGVGGYRNA